MLIDRNQQCNLIEELMGLEYLNFIRDVHKASIYIMWTIRYICDII